MAQLIEKLGIVVEGKLVVPEKPVKRHGEPSDAGRAERELFDSNTAATKILGEMLRLPRVEDNRRPVVGTGCFEQPGFHVLEPDRVRPASGLRLLSVEYDSRRVGFSFDVADSRHSPIPFQTNIQPDDVLLVLLR